MPDDKSVIFEAVFDTRRAVEETAKLEKKWADLERRAREMFRATTTEALKLRAAFERAPNMAPAKKASDTIRRMLAEEKVARDKITSAMRSYTAAAKAGDRVATQAARDTARATKAAAREVDRLAKNADRAQNRLRKMFLGVGQGSRSGIGTLVKYVTVGALAFEGLRRAIGGIRSAGGASVRFDDLTTATLTMAKAGAEAYRHGTEGAERYRKAIRGAAKDLRVASDDMALSALFWAKAGQTNVDSIAELSKVGTMFAKANRDAAGMVLEQTKANDILSDALTTFRKDTSTPEKAMAAATDLGDKMTAAANATNQSIEQLWEFAKKAAPLGTEAGMSESQILAISGSLAAAGIKAEEPGRLVRRIMTEFSRESVQKTLAEKGVKLTEESGDLRSFGAIFGDIGKVTKTMAPLDRLAFLKKIVGQNAISVAAALTGLNAEGGETGASVDELQRKIESTSGIMARNREEQLKTDRGRIDALVADWTNAASELIDKGGVVSEILTYLEGFDPGKVLESLAGIGRTLKDVVLPALQMTYQNIKEWVTPALDAFSTLLGGTSINAEELSGFLTSMIKIWIEWKVALLGIKALRMVDWFIRLATEIKTATLASKAFGTTTKAAAGEASAAVGGLPKAFAAVGPAIAAAVAAWGLYDLLTGPIRDAERRLADFKGKYGSGFEKYRSGDEKYSTLAGRIRDAEKSQRNYVAGIDAAAMSDPAVQRQIAAGQAEIDRLKGLQASQVRESFGVGTRSIQSGRYRGGQSVLGDGLPWDPWRAGENIDYLRGEWHTARNQEDPGMLGSARAAFEDALDARIDMYRDERADLEAERDATFEKFTRAAGDERDALHESLTGISDRLKENSEAIRGYTEELDGLAGDMSEDHEAEKADRREQKHEQRKKSAFRHGGRSRETDPYTVPILSGVDQNGNEIINYALKRGGAQSYLSRSPEARAAIERDIRRDSGNVVNVSFGDQVVTVQARPGDDAKVLGKQIAKAIKRYGDENKREIQRVLGSIMPAEI